MTRFCEWNTHHTESSTGTSWIRFNTSESKFLFAGLRNTHFLPFKTTSLFLKTTSSIQDFKTTSPIMRKHDNDDDNMQTNTLTPLTQQ
jgi:hypothetical protein